MRLNGVYTVFMLVMFLYALFVVYCGITYPIGLFIVPIALLGVGVICCLAFYVTLRRKWSLLSKVRQQFLRRFFIVLPLLTTPLWIVLALFLVYNFHPLFLMIALLGTAVLVLAYGIVKIQNAGIKSIQDI